MASYEFDSVIDKVLDGDYLCDEAEQYLIDLLQAAPETRGQEFTSGLSRSDLAALKIDSPEVLLFEVPGGASDKLQLDFGKVSSSEQSEIKGLVFDTDRSVRLSGLKNFEGVIGLGDGNDSVNAAASRGDIMVCSSAGNDSVTTGSGNDSVSIGSGKDSVSTGAGNDEISFEGASGGAKAMAGAGNDDILFTSGFSGGPGVKISIDGGGGNDSLDLSEMSIVAVKRAGKGVDVTLADQTVITVKSVEYFSYLDGAEVRTVGVVEFNNAFPDVPTV